MTAEFAGALDQRVTLRRRDPARDDLGAPGAGWAMVGALWAQVAPLPPTPWGEGDRPAAAQRWRATVRAGADVRPGDALDWRGAGYAVRSVVADPALPDRLVLHLEALP